MSRQLAGLLCRRNPPLTVPCPCALCCHLPCCCRTWLGWKVMYTNQQKAGPASPAPVAATPAAPLLSAGALAQPLQQLLAQRPVLSLLPHDGTAWRRLSGTPAVWCGCWAVWASASAADEQNSPLIPNSHQLQRLTPAAPCPARSSPQAEPATQPALRPSRSCGAPRWLACGSGGWPRLTTWPALTCTAGCRRLKTSCQE